MADVPASWPLGHGRLDLVAGAVHRGDEVVGLTARELELLAYLALHAHRAVPREELLKEVWRYRARYRTRAVEQTITRLRKKLELDPAAPRHLVTVHGRGYRLLAHGPSTKPESEVVQLVGPAGVGKTTEARVWALAHDAAWVSLGGVVTSLGLRRRLAESLRVTDEDLGALVRALGEAGHVVCDQVEDLDDEAAAALGSWLGACGAAVRVTTQRPLTLPGRRRVLRGLERGDALQLLRDQRRALGLSVVSDDDLQAAVDALGGHPLALRVAAPWLGVVAPGDDTLLDMPVDETTLDEALQRSIDRLDEGPRRLLGVAALAHDRHRLEELAAVHGTLHEALQHSAALRDAGLADLEGDRLHVLPLVARLARRRLGRVEREAWWGFLGSLRRSPDVLRPWRHDLERAVAESTDETLLATLLRHIQVLYTYGPRQGLLGDVEGALQRLRAELASHGKVVWCLALLGSSKPAGVSELLEACLPSLPEASWRARAHSLMALSCTADNELAKADAAGQGALHLLDELTDEALAVDVLMRASLPLRRQRDPRGRALLARAAQRAEAGGFPERALAAAMSDAFDGAADPAVVLRLEHHLERARPAMGQVSWLLQLGYVALLLLELGHLERGRDALYEALAGLTEERSENLRVRAGLTLIHFPDEARALVAPVHGRGRYRADLVRALTARPPNLAGLDEEQAALAATWLAGEPLPEDARIETVRRCLEAAPRP